MPRVGVSVVHCITYNEYLINLTFPFELGSIYLKCAATALNPKRITHKYIIMERGIDYLSE